MAVLEVSNLASGYGEVQILWGVDLALEQGKLTTLVGSNGVGKTTLLRTIMGLLRPTQGSVTFAGQDVTRLSPHARANLGLVLVPEGRQLFTDMTVHENLEMGAFSKRAHANLKHNLERVFELFPRLQERRLQKAGTLSGGEQQMVAVARGLMAEPEILILDELSLGLSPLLALNLFESLLTLKKSRSDHAPGGAERPDGPGRQRLRLRPGRRQGPNPGRGPLPPQKRRSPAHLPGDLSSGLIISKGFFPNICLNTRWLSIMFTTVNT